MLFQIDLLALLSFINVQQSFKTCTVNQWCRLPTNASASEYKFVVLTSEERMNWFDALQLCRNEGGGAELFSLESAIERKWLRAQLESFMPEENGHRSSLWLVNAHQYLYRDTLAWATGRPIDDTNGRPMSVYPDNRGISLPIRRTISRKNCLDLQNTVEAECFAINVTRQISDGSGGDRENMMLVNVQCTAAHAF